MFYAPTRVFNRISGFVASSCQGFAFLKVRLVSKVLVSPDTSACEPINMARLANYCILDNKVAMNQHRMSELTSSTRNGGVVIVFLPLPCGCSIDD